MYQKSWCSRRGLNWIRPTYTPPSCESDPSANAQFLYWKVRARAVSEGELKAETKRLRVKGLGTSLNLTRDPEHNLWAPPAPKCSSSLNACCILKQLPSLVLRHLLQLWSGQGWGRSGIHDACTEYRWNARITMPGSTRRHWNIERHACVGVDMLCEVRKRIRRFAT